MKKTLGVVMLAGICLVLVLAACGETNGLDIEATATALASVPDVPVSGMPEEETSSVSTRLGQWVEDSELAMVAYTVEDPSVPDTDRYQPKPGARLVAVELEFGCLAGSHNFTPQDTSLIDSSGRRHEAMYHVMAEHREIATGILAMGERVRGWMAYELPEGVTAESLVYKPDVYNRVIELRVGLMP